MGLTDSKYDIVIIGSGLGGLCSAYTLSKEGYKVCVLEKNRQLGGSLQIFSRDKVIFDTGIHYIGGLSEGQNLNRYFKYFGLMDKLKLKQMDMDGFDIVTFPNDPIEYKHAQGYDNFIRSLSEQFPGEKENIESYCNKMREICSFFPLYNLEAGSKDLLAAKFLEIDTKVYIESITNNKKLQNVLAGTNPLYAGEANKTPLYVHALVVNTYIESAWKCLDGGAQIAKHLSDAIKKMGGEIHNYCEAAKFNFSGSDIKNVELTDGRTIGGKTFISNCDLSKTMDMIEPGHIRQAYRHRIQSIQNTTSSFILYIVLKKGTLPYFNHNKYHYDIDDVWDAINYDEDTWPKGYAMFPQYSSKNPGYTDSLIVMGYMKYSEMEAWADVINIIPNKVNSRGESYEEFKERKSQLLFKTLFAHMPHLKGNVESYYSSTPLTYRDYIGSRDGTLYGIAKDFRDPLKTFISPKTKVPNLLLTGQNLNLHGVLGVTVSSVVTCSELLGQEYLIKKIAEAS
ncbi:phytoene desaturase family protein [Aurantibacillus circumpalustris]|uniref:phytoene desaturase family protein n=1 Tax=Aurantibacillus circumpalustris TaxID=3036359 RepID=UPI00295BB5D3|nr:FAD-dependent oxidoreductase [Aurantibacillus circumpalustris]